MEIDLGYIPPATDELPALLFRGKRNCRKGRLLVYLYYVRVVLGIEDWLPGAGIARAVGLRGHNASVGLGILARWRYVSRRVDWRRRGHPRMFRIARRGIRYVRRMPAHVRERFVQDVRGVQVSYAVR